MRIIVFSIILFIIIFLNHLLFIPIKLYDKTKYQIERITTINEKVLFSKKDFNGYFYSENECGYFSFENGLAYYKKIEKNQFILANSFFYLIYKKFGNNIQLFYPSGEFISETTAYGYPYIQNNLSIFYVLKSNGMGLSMYNMNGEARFKDINFTSIISSISTDKNLNTLVSTIDGYSYLYSSSGHNLITIESKDSKIILSKSNAIGNNGNYFAICSGLYPEYIDIYSRKTNKRTNRIKTDTNYRYKSFLCFVNDRLYYEAKDEIRYYDYIKRFNGRIKIKGEIKEIKFNNIGNCFVVISQAELYYLTVYSKDGEKRYFKEFDSEVNNLNFIDDKSFYIKLNDKIIKMVLG